MGEFIDALKEEFKGYPAELMETVRQHAKDRSEEAAWTERQLSIHKAAMALSVAKVPKEKLLLLLQKYWDLRPSEAGQFYKDALEQLDREKIK